MVEKTVKLVNEIGLHARPASVFIQEAVKYVSDIFVIKNENTYNAKSIMSVLSMGAMKGDTLILRAEGEDEEQALEALVDLVENKMKEL